MTKQQIVIGKVVAPHGVRGEFRIMPQTDNPEQYDTMKKITLGNGKVLTVESMRFHKNMVLAKTKEITTMDEAELLRGQDVVIDKKDLPPLPEGSYYVSDLVGFTVVTPEGEEIGHLKDVITPGSTDVFVITKTNGEEVMVVAIKENIKEMNIKEQKIVAVLPEWME